MKYAHYYYYSENVYTFLNKPIKQCGINNNVINVNRITKIIITYLIIIMEYDNYNDNFYFFKQTIQTLWIILIY